MLGLVTVTLHDAILLAFLLFVALFVLFSIRINFPLLNVGLVQLFADNLGEVLPIHVVERDINIITFFSVELIAYPAAGNSQRRLHLILLEYFQEEFEDGLFLLRQFYAIEADLLQINIIGPLLFQNEIDVLTLELI